MEDSAYEALYTGAYLVIFIVALSLTIFLFKTVNDYADLTFEYGKGSTDASIVVNTPLEKNRLMTGKEVMSYYYNFIEKDMYGDIKSGTDYVLQISPTTSESGYLEAGRNTYYKLLTQIKQDEKYILKYTEIKNGKTYIIIRKATEAEVTAMI